MIDALSRDASERKSCEDVDSQTSDQLGSLQDDEKSLIVGEHVEVSATPLVDLSSDESHQAQFILERKIESESEKESEHEPPRQQRSGQRFVRTPARGRRIRQPRRQPTRQVRNSNAVFRSVMESKAEQQGLLDAQQDLVSHLRQDVADLKAEINGEGNNVVRPQPGHVFVLNPNYYHGWKTGTNARWVMKHTAQGLRFIVEQRTKGQSAFYYCRPPSFLFEISRTYCGGAVLECVDAPVVDDYVDDSVHMATTVAFKEILYKQGSMTQLHNRSCQIYKLYFYMDMERECQIRDHLHSDLFWKEAKAITDAYNEIWEKLAIEQIRSHHQFFGVTNEEIEWSVGWKTFFKKVKLTFQTILALMVPVIGWYFIPDVIYGWRNSGRRWALRHIKEETMTKGNDLFQVCSLITLDKIKANMQNLPPIGVHASINPAVPDELYNDDDKQEPTEIYGTTIAGTVVLPHTGNENLYAALRMRMTHKRDVDLDVLKDFVAFSKKVMSTWPIFELSRSDEGNLTFLCSNYGNKKGNRLYKLSHEALTQKDHVSKLFVKQEVYFKEQDQIKPRMIWNRSEKIVAKFGYLFNQIGRYFKNLFNFESNVLYCSGSTPALIGEYAESMERFPYIFEADVSSWDGSLHQEMIELEVWFYNNIVKGWPDEFAQLLDTWSNPVGVSNDKEIEVKLEGCRRSGELSTSFANSLINVLITMYIMKTTNINDDKFMMLVLGDDNVVAADENLRPRALEVYKSLGMKIKYARQYSISETTFCSGRFWRVRGTYVWGNMPFRVLSKFGVNHKKHNPKVYQRLLYGTAKSLLCSSGHVPILGALCRSICDEAETMKLKPLYERGYRDYRIQGGVVQYPTLETYQQFAAIYSLSVSEIIRIEEFIENVFNLSMLPGKWIHPAFKAGLRIDVDSGDVPDNDSNVYLFSNQALRDDARREEMEKLRGTTSLAQALRHAKYFGSLEDKLVYEITGEKSNYHAQQHQLFTFISYFNLEWGVMLHASHNRRVIHETKICDKKKLKKRRKRRKKRGPKPIAQKAAELKGDLKGVRSLLKVLAKNALKGAGGMAGAYVGGESGRVAGVKLGAGISQIMGFGDYKVKFNSLMNTPVFAGKKSVRVRNCEYLTDIISSTGFEATEFPLNPAVAGTFPWVSAMANLFTEYRFHGLIFVFKSTSATALNSTNTALGTVIMSTQYNSNRDLFYSKLEMENHEFSASGSPSQSMMHAVECDPKITPYNTHFLRNAALDNDEDINLYDWGRFTIATVGMQASSTIGELWVSYDIEFLKPRLNPNAYPNPLHGRISNASGNSANTLGITQLGYGGNLELQVIINGTGYDTIVLPESVTGGTFLVIYDTHGAAANVAASLTPLYNCNLNTTGYGFSRDTGYFDSYNETSSVAYLGLITVTGAAAAFSVNYSTTFSTVDLWVLAMPGPSSWEIKYDNLASLALRRGKVERPPLRIREDFLESKEDTSYVRIGR